MFGIGGLEMVVIVVVALIMVGPEQLPAVAAKVARTWREFNRFRHEMRESLDLGLEDLDRPLAKRPGRKPLPARPEPIPGDDLAPPPVKPDDAAI